ncbi:DUF402 domain-containing protein [Lysinibacillus telephonicus]|uniref:DUF402 domain-containing protein n=1 Tax=Lysinibacillus telephonicus TaxID=1714840 RepID=UPI0039795D98
MELEIQENDAIVERKICYDSKIVEHKCKLLLAEQQRVVLLHKIEHSFSMMAGQKKKTIPKGSYTIAYYWMDKPYNLYFWRDEKGNYIGAYFNIVKNTKSLDKIIEFEDLIIDVLVLPNGEYFILDEDELPEPLEQFENGYVQKALNSLLDVISELIQNVKAETEMLLKMDRSNSLTAIK